MYLLDTNALIILMFGDVTDARLSDEAMDILQNSDELCLCVVSLWEIAIKIKIGKLNIRNTIQDLAKCRIRGLFLLPKSHLSYRS